VLGVVSALSGLHIGLRGHDEVVPVKATDLVGPPGDRDTPPLGEEGGVVTLSLAKTLSAVKWLISRLRSGENPVR
jgi:hypothetical protein